MPKRLIESLSHIEFDDKDTIRIVHKMQMNSIYGTIKICKTFMKFTKYDNHNRGSSEHKA